MNITTIFNAYVDCALWSSTDDKGDPLDDNFCDSDLAPETAHSMREDVADFVASNSATLEKSGLTESQIGHDFWLTRNGHGAGFWDRGLGDIGGELTKACKPYGSADLYVGDDGRIYS